MGGSSASVVRKHSSTHAKANPLRRLSTFSKEKGAASPTTKGVPSTEVLLNELSMTWPCSLDTKSLERPIPVISEDQSTKTLILSPFEISTAAKTKTEDFEEEKSSNALAKFGFTDTTALNFFQQNEIEKLLIENLSIGKDPKFTVSVDKSKVKNEIARLVVAKTSNFRRRLPLSSTLLLLRLSKDLTEVLSQKEIRLQFPHITLDW